MKRVPRYEIGDFGDYIDLNEPVIEVKTTQLESPKLEKLLPYFLIYFLIVFVLQLLTMLFFKWNK